MNAFGYSLNKIRLIHNGLVEFAFGKGIRQFCLYGHDDKRREKKSNERGKQDRKT